MTIKLMKPKTPSGLKAFARYAGQAVLICLATCLSAVPAMAQQPSCNAALATSFKPDDQTKVVLVRPFAKGERLVISEKTPFAPNATQDLCLVKLVVGPGNPGRDDAPSTSPGIGIEIWLPTPLNWNDRIHAMGGGGWQGGPAAYPDHVANPYAAGIAGAEGAVSSSTDTGHGDVTGIYGLPDGRGDFAMNPDGRINTVLWNDFSQRAIHVQAVMTKALTAHYYGRPARYAYWDGSSTGGRQGHKLAQKYPDDFDGIVANLPAINWTRWAVGGLYPQIVIQRDLAGKALTEMQLDLASRAAISACDMVGGRHLGYILEPQICRYDPTKDKAVLCVVDGGTNNSKDCLSPRQAEAMNKIWYGITSDGSVPDPARDNGAGTALGGKRLWYGIARGTSLWNATFTPLFRRPAGLVNPDAPFTISSDQVALALQDPALTAPGFRNATGNGEGKWRGLTYARLAQAFRKASAQDANYGHINTDNPDLSVFKARGGKMLVWHGANDEVIPVQGTMRYYDSVMARMGGLDAVQSFYRFYLIPGAGHQTPNGTANPDARPPIFGGSQLYEMLVNWVEKGIVPERVDLENPAGSKTRISQPVCPYPQRSAYVGGEPTAAASFICK